ncbi:MAG: helix-turn-helix domain-containing protein [Thermoguttaceae bacterium]
MSHVADLPEVLTPEEAAAFLRVPEDSLQRLVSKQALPGRKIDDQWRFLKAALAAWLCDRTGKDILLGQAGALADDESLVGLRNAIYESRGRSETEAE